MAIPASNRFNIEAGRPSTPVDFDAPYAPTTMTYHGFSLVVDGVTVGRFTEFTPVALDREVKLEYELNAKTWGQPVDAVPGKANNFTLAFGRAEVWGEETELAVGAADNVFNLLLDQNRPFLIDEVYLRGQQLYRVYRHYGCWFTNLTRDAFSAEGDAVVRVSGEITFVNRSRII